MKRIAIIALITAALAAPVSAENHVMTTPEFPRFPDWEPTEQFVATAGTCAGVLVAIGAAASVATPVSGAAAAGVGYVLCVIVGGNHFDFDTFPPR